MAPTSIPLERVRAAFAPRFRIQRALGSGGMSVVFQAQATADGADVAVKVLRPELGATVLADRFRQEIAIASTLRHPNILPLLESGASGSFVYYVMPFATGGSLRERLQREHRLTVVQACTVALDVAAALDHAHAQNVLHRDIKPENVMFDQTDRALLSDFGVARAIIRAAGERLSTSGLVVGTPTYMSPEQASGSDELDHRSDIYALACLVYEMLTGEPPFSGRTAQAIVARHIGERPPAVRVLRPDVPPEYERVLVRGLAKRPRRRPASAGELARQLQAAAPPPPP
jgi:serine/threonine protein kinase